MGRVRRDAGTLRQEGALSAAAAAAAALPAVRGGRGAASAITTFPPTSSITASPRLARHRLFHHRPGPRRPLQVDWALLLPVLCFHYLDASLAELGEHLKSCVRSELEETSQPVGVSSARHRAALERCLTAIDRARQLQLESGPPELTSLELRAAVSELAAITNPLDNEEILDEVFRSFCIGK